MTSEQWQRVKEVFEAAFESGPAVRTAFLAQACAGDDELRREVESLLAAHDADSGFMNNPVGRLLVSPEPSLTTGQHFGPYEDISLLGEGGMGQVYLAVDTRLGRKVALKLLPSAFMHDADRTRRFEQEARAASALNHPNIVTIHEIGQSDSLHFIATEFIDGETLREHMSNSRMTVDEVLDVATQIAAALQAAHEAGIIHRDIKPENIMLRRDGFVKVLDFGLAKLVQGNGDNETSNSESRSLPIDRSLRSTVTHCSSPGTLIGTVAYMSPEQARGQEVDRQTDIWSLGVVIYEMIAGRPPFDGATVSQVIGSILEVTPQTLSPDPHVPIELDRIVTKALSKEQSERYQNASEIVLDLKNLKEELTVESRLKQFRSVDDDGSEITQNGVFGLSTVRVRPASTIPRLTRQTISVEYFVGEIRRHRVSAFISLFILLASAIGLTYYLMNRNPAELGGKKTIAVLPLKPIGAIARDDIYEVGIADALISRLTSMKGIVVRHLGATREYRDLAQDPIAAGKEQQVDYILASSYQLFDGKIRVTAHLFNIANGHIERTFQIERDLSDTFAMQDAIATEIGNKLVVQFDTTASHLTTERGTTNEEAYRLYLHGMYLASKRNLADAVEAVKALEQAVSLDPNYAQAWAGLAYAHRTVSIYTTSVSTYETYQKSIAAINKALALDPNLSEAHSALCENKYLFEWDFEGAERECKLAIELNPNSSQAHEIFSRYLMGRGRHEEAIAEIKTAIDLEPTSRFFQRNYGRALFYARRYSEAATQFKRVLAMDENFLGTYSWLTATLAFQGNESEAFEWFMKLLSVRKADEKTVEVFRRSFQSSGWHGVLKEWLKRFELIGGNNFDGAAYNALLGNKDRAFEYLETLYQRREYSMTYVQVDPRLDSLHNDPRFIELVRRVESR